MELGKYKQALAYLKSPRLPLADGTEIEAPPKKPYTFENFKKVADLYVQTYFGTQSVDLPGFPSKKEIVVNRLNQEYEKAMEAGVDSKDALGYIQDRKKFYLGLIDKGEDFPPSYGSEEIVERTDLKEGTTFGRGAPGEKEKQLKDFVEKFKLENNGELPTQQEIKKGTGIAAKTTKSYLIEGVDYAKLATKTEAAIKGGQKSAVVRAVPEGQDPSYVKRNKTLQEANKFLSAQDKADIKKINEGKKFINNYFKNNPEAINTTEFGENIKALLSLRMNKDTGAIFSKVRPDDYYIEKAKEGKLFDIFDIKAVKEGGRSLRFPTNINITPGQFNQVFLQSQVGKFFAKGADPTALKNVEDILNKYKVRVKLPEVGYIGKDNPVAVERATGKFPKIIDTLKAMKAPEEILDKFSKTLPKAEGVKLSANPFADPELLTKYLSQIPKDAVNVGLKGLAALDVPVIQALFATMTDFAEDSPLITTLPLAFTDEASRLMGLYNESGGNFKKFTRFLARAGVPIEGAKKLFPIVSKVGKIGSTYALPALQIAQETYQYKQELDRVREEAENFNLPIDKAMKAYDKFLDINTPPILDYDEESTLSDRGRQNLDAIKRDFQEIGALFGIGESPYKDDTPDQPSAFSPPLAERRKPDFKKDSGITSYRPSSDDRNFLAKGGIVQRLNFKDGTPKKGINRRSFLKLATLVPATIAGLASIRLGPAKTKKIFTTIENIKDPTTKIPDWFATFANKFRNTGIAENLFKTKKVKLTEGEYNKAVQAGEKRVFNDSARTIDYKINKPDHMDYYRLEDTDEVIATTYTNKKIPGVKIEDYGDEVVVNWNNEYNQPIEMRYQKGQDFVATDSTPYTTDLEGGFDIEDEIVRTVDDMYEGTSRTMEEFATGKKVKQKSSGELSVMDAELRAQQLAEETGFTKDIEGDPINLTTRDADD